MKKQTPTTQFTSFLKLPKVIVTSLVLALFVIAFTTLTYAGNLTPPGAPANTMYTLTDLYDLASAGGATTTEGSGGLPATPGATSSTFYTLTDIYEAIAGEINNLASTTLATGTSAFGIDGTAYLGGVVTTGQDTCYNTSGTLIGCSGTGQDGESQAGLAFSYTDNGDDTVTDNNTGLVWEQTYSTTTRTWQQALDYCNNNVPGLPGTGWRLPNVKELFSLVDFGISGSAKIDLTAFPGTPASIFWSATTYPNSGPQNFAMLVDFDVGVVYNVFKTSSRYVRCVQE
jgi:hypothetical protein